MKKLFFLILSIFIFYARDAHAYLDPGTGSYILQAIAALGIGAIIGIKVFWRNIKVFIVKVLSIFKQKP